MKSEFDQKLGKESKDIDWEAIETVYMWHPAFDRTDAKKVAVDLYKMLGVRPFLEMYDPAVKARNMDAKIQALKIQLTQAKEEYKIYKEENC